MKLSILVRAIALAVVLCSTLIPASAEEARLLRNPAISQDHVAFVYAGDVWIVDRDGGAARRLTTFHGTETDPHFSPDGTQVAFSGQYDGNVDVYVVPLAGGEPRRLTWHPDVDVVSGWSPDGESVLFGSGRVTQPRPWPRLWTIATSGGMPTQLPIPRAFEGRFSPDGKHIAYEMLNAWDVEWRNYRGGQAQPIRLIDLETLEVTKIPGPESVNVSPAWIGDKVFFLSDRDWAMNVWEYDVASGAVTQRTHFKEFDCKRLDGGADNVVFENGGYLYSMSAAGGEASKLSIELKGDFPWARPHWEDVSESIRTGAISPTGKRAVFEARGEIFTVPAEKGDVRNLTRSSGAADRTPVWSPDGKTIAWFSDEGGEYRLVLADQFGKDVRSIALPDPTFFYTPAWSPDSEHLAYADADRNLWVIEIDGGKPKLVDREGFAHPNRVIYPAWSPDSKWIAYTKRLESQFSAIFAYSMESGETSAITDGLSNAHSPAWDRGGKFLYFQASTDYALNVGWLDMTSIGVPVTDSIYLAVLARDEPSPLGEESDDETVEEDDAEEDDGDEKGKKKSKKDDAEEGDEEEDQTPEVKIDFEGLAQRVLALDVPARNYSDLTAGAEGTVYFLENIRNEPGASLHMFSLEEREDKVLGEGIGGFAISADGKKMLYANVGGQNFIVDAGGEIPPGEGALDLSGMRMKVDPAQEWTQIFREAWRYQRDFFYVDNVHGMDLDWVLEAYGAWVPHVRHRDDLNYVLDILGGETSVGHSFNSGGDTPDVEFVPVGLLGADWEIDDGRYRITKIYNGENWNPGLRSPLSGPGIDATVGDYLVAVDGVELTSESNLFVPFDRTAGRQTRISLNDKPQLDGARELTVVPVGSEVGLRQLDWVEGNRRKVDELSGGKLAYVWIPDTGFGGWTSFNRYFFAQQHKKGAIIDERFNHGGSIADYIVDYLARDLMGYFNNPIGDRQPFTAPNAAIWGPKVMLINEMSGSGGDMLPYMFAKREIGPLVGTKTWGGLVGIWDVPDLIDGGSITAPRGGFYDTDGNWAVENEGVPPDVEVEQLPKLVAAGHDPQLEKAVEIALEMMKTEGIEMLPQPADPVRVRRPE
jgi:tricorn protease